MAVPIITHNDHALSNRSAGPKPMRRDIQGLRAVAVGAVLLNHLWPHRLTGGFVGVDVFFVISGFLITTHLLQQEPRRPRDLVLFWARRIRRLLPAASLVLLTTMIASAMLLPASRAIVAAKEAIAAALYVENWYLALTATDYFAADVAPSPIRHYWSLSVEEQFYLVWPIIIAASVFFARKNHAKQFVVLAAILGVIAMSFIHSVWFTHTDPAAAYFITTTRMWELAIGGLAAWLMLNKSPKGGSNLSRIFAAWLGLAMVLWAVIAFSEQTPFPSWTAMLPVVGTALIILADADGLPGSPDALWRTPGVQTLGDASYSIYLWHWPLIVLAPLALGEVLRWPDKIVIGMISVLLAVATKKWVEDPARKNVRLIQSSRLTLGFGASLMLIVVLAAFAVIVKSNHQIEQDDAATAELVRASGPCFGAAAASNKDCDIAGESRLMSPSFAATDKPEVYEDDCWNRRPFTSRKTCEYGSPNAKVNVALIGNSHAGHWQPALTEIANRHGWNITTYLVSECWTADVPQIFEAPSDTDTCREWVRWAIDETSKGDYDLIVTSNRTWRQIQGISKDEQKGRAQEAYGVTLDRWSNAGKNVLVLRDVPNMTENVPDCLEREGEKTDACLFPRKDVLPVDPLAEAAKRDDSGQIDLLDLSEVFCDESRCRSVVGGLIVYFDTGHMTATFSRTLVPLLEPALLARLN